MRNEEMLKEVKKRIREGGKNESVKIKIKIPHSDLDAISKKVQKSKKEVLAGVIEFLEENCNCIENDNKFFLGNINHKFKTYTLDKKSLDKLNNLSKENNLSRSDVVYHGIFIWSKLLNIGEKVDDINESELLFIKKTIHTFYSNKEFIEIIKKISKFNQIIAEYEGYILSGLEGIEDEIDKMLKNR